MNLKCPTCSSECIKKNGHIHNGKQNHRCLSCGRQFVEKREQKILPEEKKEEIQQALLERVSLHGICRIFKVSLTWLLDFMESIFRKLPDHLNVTYVTENEELEIAILEMDEQYGYVGNKKNDQWLWLAFHSASRQVVSFHVGKRTKSSGLALLEKLPEDLKKKALFFTDKFNVYYEIIPWAQHHPVGKESGKTSYIERFNCTLRQRIPRLVRKTLSFSKKLANPIGMIKYFICDYNLRKALHV